MNTETIIEKFETQEIAFDLFQGDLMINATEMAKPFGKRVDNYLRLSTTKALIKALKVDRIIESNYHQMEVVEDENSESNYLTSEVVESQILTTKEGQHGGTFMCEDLALAFAMWLSPVFNVWVLKTIRKIIFGNNPTLVREAVYNLPKLFEQAKPLRKKLSRLKSKELSKEFRTEFGKLVEEKRSVEIKITQLAFQSQNPGLWDKPEILGKELVKWATRRDELEVAIAKMKIEEQNMINTPEIIKLQVEVDGLTSVMKQYSQDIRTHRYNFHKN